ncbi:hypothetical protein [Alkalihalobacillus trypoxylicola]|uniref:hypothetical protein n=1 Tax=Alkalihalobacillus trypoxylicola TaxID=519424 RepID=UPI000B0A5943|nr:hypothetical protein [Alkalihalobacillus trypoxylicola]
MYYALHELHYSPAALEELYKAPKNYKALLYGMIDHKLEVIAKESKKAEKKR